MTDDHRSRGARQVASPFGPARRRPLRAGVFCALLFAAALPAARGGAGPEKRSPRRRDSAGGRAGGLRAPVALNDDHDCGLAYTARRFWDCRAKCPDGGCDHRTLEPVWDNLYVGGRVEAEDDLLELELAAPPEGLPAGASVRLEVADGAESVRLWPDPKKGAKRDIVPNAGLALKAGDLPRKIYLEGIRTGTAELRLSADADGAEPFVLFVDVLRLVEEQGGERRFIYDPGAVTLRLEPAGILDGPAYRDRIEWEGDASGSGPRLSVTYDPGEKAEMRRAVYRHRAVVNGGLALAGEVKVKQRVYSGTPVAATTAARRREVESLLPAPKFGLMQTALPNQPGTQYSQAWFERHYTGPSGQGDPVKPVNQARLQYAPAFDHRNAILGVACCYLKPYGVFITRLAYDSGLKREDLAGVATHELRHLEHYSVMYKASGLWHVLCRYLAHDVASYYMEADAYSAALHADCTWRFLQASAKSFAENYRSAALETGRLKSLPQMTSAISVLQDIYAKLPADMREFKRPDYACFIRPPLEIDEK